jgi:D-hexose-6-phosphate mutarotase
MGRDDWRSMLCVETANAADDAVTVAPGGTHVMTATLRVDAR